MVPFGNRQDVGIEDKTLFGKIWEQTKVTLRLIVGYFNWIWVHSRARNHGGSTCRPNLRTLDLAKYCCLSHTLLRHNHRSLSVVWLPCLRD
jgi:hypothetical protein